MDEFEGDAPHIVEIGSRRRVEVDAQLIRMIVVGVPGGPGMEDDGAVVGCPHDVGGHRGSQRISLAARRERDGRGQYMFGSSTRDALLVDLITLHPVGIPFDECRPVADGRQHRSGQREGAVVADEISFAAAVFTEFGKVDLVGVRQPHGDTVDVEFLGGRPRSHVSSLPARRAGRR